MTAAAPVMIRWVPSSRPPSSSAASPSRSVTVSTTGDRFSAKFMPALLSRFSELLNRSSFEDVRTENACSIVPAQSLIFRRMLP